MWGITRAGAVFAMGRACVGQGVSLHVARGGYMGCAHVLLCGGRHKECPSMCGESQGRGPSLDM